MCDQSTVQYNDGDVVWVKLGPCWWPGEVHDIKRVPPEIQPGLKKPPIAFVHFFQEDKYEYVRSLDYIYHYNCRRKHEFIKKGLDMHRAKQKHMDKFPVDVCTAETLTNGDPDIITSEEFAPQQKVNYANLFGSPANRKSASKRNSLGSGGKPGRGRKSASSSKITTSTPTRYISKQLASKAYEVHDLSQRDDSTSSAISDSASNVVYDCDRCDYTCTRLNVITYHHKMHIDEDNGIVSPGKGKKKSKSKITPQNKLAKIARCSTSTIDEDLELLSQGIDLSTYDCNKKKPKSPKIKFAKSLKLTEKKKKKEDVKGISNLLADWDDSESEKEEDKTEKSVDSTVDLSLNVTGVDPFQICDLKEISKDVTEKSCFDFEEDEEVATIISKSPGRKIPRVIPENQKSKTPEDTLDATVDLNASVEPKDIDNADSSEIVKPLAKAKRNRKSKVGFEEVKSVSENTVPDSEIIKNEFDQLMAETALPELPLLTKEPTALLSELKTPDKKSRVRKKYELFSKDKSPDPNIVSNLDTSKSEKKSRNRKKTEEVKEIVHQELEEESDGIKTVEGTSKQYETHETRGKRKSEIIAKENEVEKNQSIEIQDKKELESISKNKDQEKPESRHSIRGKKKSEIVFKEKASESTTKQTESRSKRKSESVDKISNDVEQKKFTEDTGKDNKEQELDRKDTSANANFETPKERVEPAVADQKESLDTSQKSKKVKSDLKEKSPEMKLDKLFSDKPERKRGRKSGPTVEKSEESVVASKIENSMSDNDNLVDDYATKKTRSSRKSELISKEIVESPSETTAETSKPREKSKRRGVSVIPKDFKDIYSKSDSSQIVTKENEKSDEYISKEESVLSESTKSQLEVNLQTSTDLDTNNESVEIQQKKQENKESTPKRTRRQKPETSIVEEIKADFLEDAVDLKMDNKRSKRHKADLPREKIDEPKDDNQDSIVSDLDTNKVMESPQTKHESKEETPKRSRRQKAELSHIGEIKADFLEETIDMKLDKRSKRHKVDVPKEKVEESIVCSIASDLDTNKEVELSQTKQENKEETPKRSRRQKVELSHVEEIKADFLEEAVDSKIDNKRSKRQKPDVLKEKVNESKDSEGIIDAKTDNRRSRRSCKLPETVEENVEEIKLDLPEESIEIKSDNKRSMRSQKLNESTEEKPENVETKLDNKRSKKSPKIIETEDNQSEILKVETIVENVEMKMETKRSRRSQHKAAEIAEDKLETTKEIDVKSDNKRSKRLLKLSEPEQKDEDLKPESLEENVVIKLDNKRSKRLLKSEPEEKTEELKPESIDENIVIKIDNKRSKRLIKCEPDAKLEELKSEFTEENMSMPADNKRLRRSQKSATLEEKAEELDENTEMKLESNQSKLPIKQDGSKDKIDELQKSIITETIELKLDNKRSRKQKMEVMKDNLSEIEGVAEFSPDVSSDKNIDKNKIGSPRKSKRHQLLSPTFDKREKEETHTSPTRILSPRHKFLKTDEKVTETSNDEDIEVSGSDNKKRQSPIKETKKESSKNKTDHKFDYGAEWDDNLSDNKDTISKEAEEMQVSEMIQKPREVSRILRKRGRFSHSSPTHSSKELISDSLDANKPIDESLNVGTSFAFQETSSLTDCLLNIKKPSFSYREASAKAALELAEKSAEQKSEKYELFDIKSSSKIEKSRAKDDSVKVMISLNDFKMEDIPLPPMPTQSTLKATSKEKETETKVDATPNTSQEFKRTPIKFEISKMKAQINKKLITHKSFLTADEDEENSLFSRRISPLHSEKSSVERNTEKESVSEAPPKKRVMADYKKELEVEKSKEKDEQEKKIQLENPQIDEVSKEIISLNENKISISNDEYTQKVDEITENQKDAIESCTSDLEKLDEKITGPLKHEDISAVIISGTEVKIIDPSSESFDKKDGNQIVQQIVHEPITETMTTSLIETFEENEIDISSTDVSASPAIDNIDEVLKENLDGKFEEESVREVQDQNIREGTLESEEFHDGGVQELKDPNVELREENVKDFHKESIKDLHLENVKEIQDEIGTEIQREIVTEIQAGIVTEIQAEIVKELQDGNIELQNETEVKQDENVKQLQEVLENKDENDALLNQLTQVENQPKLESEFLSTKDDNSSTAFSILSEETVRSPVKVVSTPDYVDELESIENEIQKITSSESSPCKANIFPENIAMTTPTKDHLSMSDSLIHNKDLYAPSEVEHNTSLLLSSETKPLETVESENSIESEIAKLTDTKPEENEIIPEQSFSTTSSKLLEILESKSDKTKIEKKLVPVSLADRKQTFVGLTAAQKRTVSLGSKFVPPKATKFVIKSSTIKDSQSHSIAKKTKPIILSEEIIKPANNDMKATISKGVATKRNFEEDIEDKGGIKKFIIEKAVADPSTASSGINKASRIKPTVLSQTIITSTGKIIDGGLDSNKELADDNMFDINSMPIVLSDDLLTPECIENMPIVISNASEPEKSNTVQIMNKSSKVSEKMKIVSQQKPMIKSVVHQGISKNQKVYQTGSTKLLSNKTAVITQPGKPEKFIILPSASSTSTGSKYTVGKRQIRTTGQSSIVVSKSMSGVSPGGSIIDAKTKASLQSGNKVMVVTNAQGQQSRIILSPAQQKMLGSKMGTKIVARGSPVTKGTTLSLNNIVTSKGAILTPTSTMVQTKTQTVSPQTVVTSKGQLLTSVHSQSIITSKGQILTPVTPTQMKALKGGVVQGAKKIQLHQQKIILPANTTGKQTLQSIPGMKTKTVLVKGSQRQIVQKLQTNTGTPGQLRTIVQKSPLLKTVATSSAGSSIITGKQKLTIAPKTPNVIKRQIIRTQGGTPTATSHQRITLQKMSSEMKSSPIQRPPQQKIVEQKSFVKKPSPSPVITSSQSVPPLVPLSSPPKTDTTLSQNINIEGPSSMSTSETSAHSPKQLIIQDDMGNQTSITQGQILAVPGGEVVDGQPQSYMLVTVDESGNLLPLDNQALMALDPNLIGPDGNVMLQFNQGLNAPTTDTSTNLASASTNVLSPNTESAEITKKLTENLPGHSTQDYQQLLITDDQQNLIALAGADQQLLMTDNQNLILADQTVLQDPKVSLPAPDQAVTYSIANAEDGQQIFISGDPEKAQHLINALASGNQDLSQIMSNTEGNLIINADGQHIILNTDSAGAEQIILATSTDGFSLPENYNSDYATQVTTNQDILAAALANTVFPQESAITEGLNIVTSATGGPLMSTTSELSPSLYQNMQLPNLPSGAVLETSLTNLAPIMSPLEVPTSGTSKKVPLDIETTSQVPKSLELPITITDPNIAQTVNSQLANELQTNLGLPITITDPNISNVRTSELSTSTFGYSLPSIDDSVQVSESSSAGPISMPLLTEDLETETIQMNKSEGAQKCNESEIETQPEELTNIFEPSKTGTSENQIEEIENSGNGLDVLASVTTASGMINVTENNSELEHIFAEKKDDQQLPANVFARNTFSDNDNEMDENKESNNDCENTNVIHDTFSRSRLSDHFDLGSPHSEIDANSDEISIQPSIVTEEGNSNHSLPERNSLKRSFDGLEDDDDCDENKKSKFDIS